jgi:hypothetical protein
VATPGGATAAEVHDPPVGRRHRVVAYGLIGLVALCGLARIEAWPLSGFRLFSAVRHDTHESWSLRTVTGDDEAQLSVAELPVAFRNTTKVLDHFDELSAGERDEICAAWVLPLREDGTPVDFVRVYLVTRSVRPDGPPPHRELVWECGHR